MRRALWSGRSPHVCSVLGSALEWLRNDPAKRESQRNGCAAGESVNKRDSARVTRVALIQKELRRRSEVKARVVGLQQTYQLISFTPGVKMKWAKYDEFFL